MIMVVSYATYHYPFLVAIAEFDVQGHLTIIWLCRIAPHVAFTLIFVATLPKIQAKVGL